MASGITGGLALLFILFKSSLFDFASPYDSYFKELGYSFIEAVREDRMTLFTIDAIRSLIFVLVTTGVLWFFLKNKLKKGVAIAVLGILIIIDLVGVDRRYVNNDDFVMARVMNSPFQENFADKEILKDKEYFRVYDVTTSPFNSGRASYFHNALGGYHAAKPGRMQDVDNFYLSKGNIGILNMMNVHYIITPGKNGTAVPQRNPYANGPAWMVENVIFAKNANEEIRFLDSLDTKKTAIINQEFKNLLPLENIQRDSTATIILKSHAPNRLVYKTSTKSPQLAIFSEVYYPKGWNVYIDNEPATYFRANYVLRAMTIPEGEHTIEFKFEPEVVKTGSKISLASSILFMLVFVGGVVFLRKKESH